MPDYPQCDNCKDGRHRIDATPDGECLSERDLLPVQCGCWCLGASHPSVALRRHRPLLPGTDYALDLLKRAHVDVRTRRSTGLLVWKPTPRNMHEKLLHEVRANKLGLQIALAAWRSPLPIGRAGWSYGRTAECYGCGKSCVVRDPLGHCRHSWCGWLGQVPIEIPVVQVPMYPKHAA